MDFTKDQDARILRDVRRLMDTLIDDRIRTQGGVAPTAASVYNTGDLSYLRLCDILAASGPPLLALFGTTEITVESNHVQIIRDRRPWRARLWSWPWRPWQATEARTVPAPPLLITVQGRTRVIMHPTTYHAFKREVHAVNSVGSLRNTTQTRAAEKGA